MGRNLAEITAFPRVPLLNQPLEVLGWTLLLSVQCRCDAPKVVTLIVKQNELGRQADLGICPSCARPMHVASLGMNASNQLEFGIELGATPVPVVETGVTGES
jgi:hypothetical protein